jgi:predicted TIM-barrel fold metal-dependent hydrolase
MSKRLLLISCDCHIDFPFTDGKQFFESKYHDDLAAWVAKFQNPAILAANRKSQPDRESRYAFHNPVRVEDRLRALDENGVAAEVLIPNPTSLPFFPTPGLRSAAGYDWNLHAAGYRAYNRWLAGFVDRDRQAGLAQILYEDVNEAVAEIRRAARANARGVLLDGQMRGLPPLFDSYYDPIWAALQDENLVATFHGGTGYEPEFDAVASPAAFQLMLMESLWFSHRPLWFLIYGGVLERFPDLKVAFTEQYADWIPGTLKHMDYDYEETSARIRRDGGRVKTHCPRKPSDYWHRQCYVGASIMSGAEIDMRHEIGVETIMYGTDFAHPEGTWNKTLEHLQALFGARGVPESEIREICGLTAARVYQFDEEKLAPLVARIGFPVNEITMASELIGADVASAVNRPSRGW